MSTARQIRTVLFDLDHTLFDTESSELAAFDATLVSAGVVDPRRHLETYISINRALWAGVERGEVTPNEVAVARFVQLVAVLDLDADPHQLADTFLGELGANGDLYPGARALIDRLAIDVEMALITNGVGRVQRDRLQRLGLADHFSAVVISGEVGTSKPGTDIFDLTFRQLGRPRRETAVMIGDSLTSDIRGGRDYGIATCWYNPNHTTRGPNDDCTFEVHDLEDIAELLLG